MPGDGIGYRRGEDYWIIYLPTYLFIGISRDGYASVYSTVSYVKNTRSVVTMEWNFK